ncbi:MAG: hypothetical protein LBU67_02460, partial [Oscillospiraceae bacterium]|nr:hypothetical protein [Oscillospiraceae bacterium]
MGYKIGKDKQQLTFAPKCLDEFIPEDHICRVIDAFTGSGQNNHLAIQEKYKRDESNARKALSEMRKDRKPSP